MMTPGLDGGVGRINSNDLPILPRVAPDRDGLKNSVHDRNTGRDRQEESGGEESSEEESSDAQEQPFEDGIQELTNTSGEDDHEIDCLA